MLELYPTLPLDRETLDSAVPATVFGIPREFVLHFAILAVVYRAAW